MTPGAPGAPGAETYVRPELHGGWVRACWRGTALLVWCVSVWLAWLVVGFATRPFEHHYRRTRFWFFRTWGRGALPLLGVRAEIRGRVPERPVLLVSNHVSYVDIPLIASAVDCAFVAKAEIASWPFAGWLASSVHTIYVARERRRDLPRVNELIERALDSGLSVVVFAEGQSTSGRGLLPFRTPLFATPARRGLPVRCAAVHYAAGGGTPPAREVVSFYGDVGFAEHVVRLLRAPGGYRGRLTFDTEEIVSGSRKELAARAGERVAACFEPVE